MGDLRTRNANRWANYVSFFPIWGGKAGRAIQQNALAKNQAEEAAKMNPQDVTYQESPYAKEQLDLARNAIGSRMPGSAQAEANIARNQSNSFLNLARAAGSPQIMMQAAGAVQNSSNNALNQLAAQEAQYKNSMLSNLNNALIGMTNEQGKVYNDQLRKFDRDFAVKQNLLNSSQLNKANANQSINDMSTAIVNTVLPMLNLNTQPKPTINPTGPAQQYGFNPTAGWFTPQQATYTPSIYGRP